MDDLRWVLDELSIGVWVGSVPSGKVVCANQAFERILGMESVAPSRIDDVPDPYGIFDVNGKPYPIERLPFSRVVATGAPVIIDDIVARRPTGSFNIRAFGSPVFGPGGALSHVIVAFMDITKEIEARVERDQVEARLRFVCNHSPIAIWTTDADGVITMSEGAGLASLGVKSGDLVGRNVLEIYEAHPKIPGYVRRGLAGESFWYTVEVGDAVYDTWLTPLHDPDGRLAGVAGLSNDVSQLRMLQKTAIQNDRVIAVGTLAASVAHEINNPLTYILGYGDDLEKELGVLEGLLARLEGQDAPAARASLQRMKQELDAIRSGTRRIADVTRDLRTFSRPEENTLSAVDPGAVVASVLKLVGKEVQARAHLVVDVGSTPPVMGNEGRLVQVVLNLVMNALQALPSDAGRAQEIAVRVRSEGSRVIIEVADSGPGVPPGDRERIFEAFYSTKEIGEGTGLGLFVCRNIVRGLSGDVEMTDRPGGGALFRVWLPVATVPLPVAAEPSRPPAPGRTGAHVVVIEDDAMVARSLVQLLRSAGYRVTAVADGQEGLATVRELRDVDLIFCDLMMTGMTGMDLADVLEKEAPELARKMVFMTGGAFSPRAREFVARHRDHTVDKPFDIVEEARRRMP